MRHATGPGPGVGTSSLVSVRGLKAAYAGRAVLRDIDLEVARGEIVVVIGPNGAGKSTLARVLIGGLKPSAGQIVRAPGLRLGYVPQRVAIEPNLPVTVRRLMTLTERHAQADILDALGLVHAQSLIDRQASGLSGGELQRVLLARALLGVPDLLILDEPAQSIDQPGQAHLYDLLERVRRERHCGILMISHDLTIVMGSADRVICINGHICCEGVPSAVAEDPAFRALFGPAQANRFALFPHHHNHVHEPDDAADACGGGH